MRHRRASRGVSGFALEESEYCFLEVVILFYFWGLSEKLWCAKKNKKKRKKVIYSAHNIGGELCFLSVGGILCKSTLHQPKVNGLHFSKGTLSFVLVVPETCTCRRTACGQACRSYISVVAQALSVSSIPTLSCVNLSPSPLHWNASVTREPAAWPVMSPNTQKGLEGPVLQDRAHHTHSVSSRFH